MALSIPCVGLLLLGLLRGIVYPAPGESTLPQGIRVTIRIPMEAIDETVGVDLQGGFVFDLSTSGDGVIIVEAPGYKTRRIELNGEDRLQDLRLQLGARLVETAGQGPKTTGIRQLSIPKRAVREFEKGVEQLDQGKPREAIQQFLRAIQLFADYAEASNNLGIAYLRLGEVQKAEQAFREAIRIDDQAANPYKNLGHLYLTTDRASESVPLLDQAAKLDPLDPAPREFLGEALYQLGEFEAAVEPLARALELDPKAYRASYRLGFVYLRLEKYAEALRAFEDFLATNQDFDTEQVRHLVQELKARLPEGERTVEPGTNP